MSALPYTAGAAATAVLHNSDLLSEIFNHLAPFSGPLVLLQREEPPADLPVTEYTSSCRRTLVAAALTCCAFAEPASRVLWQVLYSGLLPLLCPLSAFKIVTDSTNRTTRYVLDSDDVSLEDLARWKHCTRRVRHLVLSHTEKSLLEAPFAPFFLRCATSVGESIFPLLKTIAFQETSGSDPAKKQLLRACLSPNLTSIAVLSNIPYHFSAHLDDDLEMLSTACDNVQRITIMSHLSLLIHNPPLTGFRQLRAIDLGLVSWEESRPLVSQLRALEKLEELRIAFWHINFGEPQRPPLQPDPQGFLALRKLRLVGRAPATEQALSSIGSASLQYLEIAQMGMDTFADFDTLVRAAPWMQIASSLRQLYLGLNAELYTLRFCDVNPVHAEFFSILAPLADMHALEVLEVATWNRVLSISDDAVAQMGTAWPRLQHLSVHFSSTFALEPDAALFTPYDTEIMRPTLSALVHLAECCPSLAYCAIDAASVSEAELVVLEGRAAAVGFARMGTTQTRLEQLVPAHWVHSKHFTLPDVERVAHALRSLFPSIEGVGVGEPDSNFPPLLPFKRANRDLWSEDANMFSRGVATPRPIRPPVHDPGVNPGVT